MLTEPSACFKSQCLSYFVPHVPSLPGYSEIVKCACKLNCPIINKNEYALICVEGEKSVEAEKADIISAFLQSICLMNRNPCLV